MRVIYMAISGYWIMSRFEEQSIDTGLANQETLHFCLCDFLPSRRYDHHRAATTVTAATDLTATTLRRPSHSATYNHNPLHELDYQLAKIADKVLPTGGSVV
ncbi:hypothetical protein RJ640_001832 [Escallonia rubra]|uniref:Uncharacterized protein n=1 Tax=Escallonia rubra TaxID=112253 RepID=A0AA88ULH8_9ASTE|nr:hypothetical protein RJ640_001832 [Escallonia rubra]